MTMQRFLRERGWKKHMGTWWYKPLPESDGALWPNQRIFCTRSAVEAEQGETRLFNADESPHTYSEPLPVIEEPPPLILLPIAPN